MNNYKNKTVIITGHTGFKGSWLSIYLKSLGSNIIGVSKDIPYNPSNFEASNLKSILNDQRIDILDYKRLNSLFKETQPDYVFHLAAQPLVRESYSIPVETMKTNAIGSANILECARGLEKKINLVMITSDKAYDNVEWKWGYRENDKLGGKDPYSASKGMAELAIRSFVESYSKNNSNNTDMRVGIARAGNVIGGGDWSPDRIVPDCIKNWNKNKTVEIRNPESTRPWQHVLEPISGYLMLGQKLEQDKKIIGEAYNFGPKTDSNYSVHSLIKEMSEYLENFKWNIKPSKTNGLHEAGLLKLNCDKALADLNWRPTLDFKQTVKMTCDWYHNFYHSNADEMLEFCNLQLKQYKDLAKDSDNEVL